MAIMLWIIVLGILGTWWCIDAFIDVRNDRKELLRLREMMQQMAKREKDVEKRQKELEIKQDLLDKREKSIEKKFQIKQEILDKREKSIEKEISNFKQQKQNHEALLDDLRSYGINLSVLRDNFAKVKKEVDCIKEYISAISNSFDKLSEFGKLKLLASVTADIESLKDFLLEDYLKRKSHPAYSAAEVVSQVKKEKRELRKQLKTMQYEYELLCQQIPHVTEYAETPEEVMEEMLNISNEEQGVEDWLSKEEWTQLDSVARLQLALDRYNQRHKKSNRRVGYDYELYCGYNIEYMNLLGCKVDSLVQYGIEEGLSDLGRDIIASCGDKTYIIQCKRWGKERPVRENTIMQLYGSAAEFCMNKYKNEKQSLKHLGKDVIPVLMTTTELSDVAIRFAKYLNVKIERTSFDATKYPQIKCNISKDGEKIYHLPFDQQYDKIKIEKEKGECFVFTIKEAEELGFRHAMKWQGDV